MKRNFMQSKIVNTFVLLVFALLFSGTAWGQTILFSEDFEDGSMPSGWTTDGNGSWSVATAVNSSHPSSAGQGTYCAQIKHGTSGDATKLITPIIDLSSVTSAELSFMHVEQSWVGDIDGLKVYYRTSTSGTWVQLESYLDAYESWTTEDGIVLPNLSSTYQLAFEFLDNYGYGLGIDYIQIVQGASCVKPTSLTATPTSTTSASISWTANNGETSWNLRYRAVGAGSWTTKTGVIDNPYNITTGIEADTEYEVQVQAICGGGDGNSDYTSSATFYTGYCTPAPTSVDGSGITNVTFGSGLVVNDNLSMTSSPYYYNHSSSVGEAMPASTIEISIDYATNYTYYTWVWIDWNNDLTFSDDELVYPSTNTISSGTLTIEFNIPPSVAAGEYRLRIQGADDSSKKNPCYTGTYSYLIDYTLRVLALTDPYITLSPSSATVLTGFTQSLTAIYGNVSGTPTITYTSSNTSVATLSGSGTSVTVTGLAIGSATITASMTVNGTPYTATCAITVADPSYCEPYFSNPSEDYISSFVTTGGTSNISNSTGASTGGYGDYYSSYSASITAGETLSCTVTPNTNSYSYGHAIWVDWNKDGDFSDSGEKVDYTTSTATGIWTGYISVPAATPTGDYRIRVIHLYNGTPTDPCMSETYGEAEDYKLTVFSQTEPYILLSPSTATVLTGFSETLIATYGNAGTPTITYTSSDSNVASVSGSGTTATVIGVAAGFATITASMTVNGTPYTATCAITVEDPSYCTPSYSETSDYIKSFVTTGGTTNISNTNTSQGTGGYSDFYSSHSASITPGETLSFSVTRGYSDSYKYAIWVDWNHDYVFDVSTEVVASVTTSQNSDWSGSFTVPANTPAGDYRMRVEMLYGSSNTLDPCVSASYGEVEDYKLTVLSLSCPAPTGLIAGTPNTNSVQLSWTAGGSEQSWQICVNGDEGDLVSANSNPFNLTSLMQGTTYTVKVRAYCDENDQSTWSNSVTFTTEESCPKPMNVHAGNLTQHTAQITWNGNADSYTVRYRTATINGTTLDPVFEDGFESGLGSWTTYANDFQASDFSVEFNITDWHQLSDASKYAHTGSYMAMSRSYDGNDRSVDNWLVTPQMTLGDVVKFWVAGDAGWPEYYAVYVSTETNDVSDFVMIEAPSFPSVSDEWEERTVDISTYAGQTGYVAIRHTDTGKDYLLIDDFGVYNTINTYSYGTENTITPATSPCNITGLDAETLYEVSVQSDCGGDGTSGWSSIYFTTPDGCAAPTDLVSSNLTSSSVTLGWADNQESYNLRYRKVYFYEGFEGETLPTGWTAIDDNGDGNTWSIGHATAHSGNNGAYNISYIYNTSGTTPDDWLVSPQLDLQGTLRVWLSGYTEYDNAEHFAIYVSTTGNSVSDFSTTLVGETTTSNAYVEYTADLSTYEGQQGYIAIHHFNCEDQRYLYVDDFGIYGSENWVSVSPNPTDATASLTGLSAGTDYEWQVQGLSCNNNGDNTAWSAPSNFTTLCSIATSVSIAEAGSITGAGDYARGGSCSLTATADDCYNFVNWTDENDVEVSTDATYSFTVTGSRILVANFTHNNYTVTVNAGEGGSASQEGNGTYACGTTATLSATPSDGYCFAQWSDGETANPREVTVTEAASYTANFTHYLEVSNIANVDYCVTGDHAAVSAAPTAGSGNYTYTWQMYNGSSWVTATDATNSATYNPPYSTTGTVSYKVSVADNNGCAGHNSVVKEFSVKVSDVPSITLPAPTVCSGSALTFVPEVETNGKDLSSSSYQISADQSDWSEFTNGSTVTNEQNNNYIKYTATNGCGSSSQTVQVAVNSPSVGTLSADDYSICPGEVVSLAYSATGSVVGELSCEWKDASNNTVSDPTSVKAEGLYTANVTATNTVNGLACTATGSASGEVSYKVPTSSERTTMGIDNKYYIWTGNGESWADSDNWMRYTSSDGKYTLITAPNSSSANVVVGKYEACASRYPDTLKLVDAGKKVQIIKIASGAVVYSSSKILSVYGNMVNNGRFDAPIRFRGTTLLSGNGTNRFRGISIYDANSSFTSGDGDITIYGNWTNNGTYTAGTGKIIFTKTSTIAGDNATTFKNVQFNKSNGKFTISTETTITGTATFTKGIVSGDITFASTGTSTGASTSSYVDGTVTKNGNGSSFTFPTGANKVLGTITATIANEQSATARFHHKTDGFTQEDGYPRWWNVADMCGADPFNHVSNFEYWDFTTTANLTNVKFVSKATAASAHFNDPSTYPDLAHLDNVIQVAVYDECWKNAGGNLAISADYKTITISGVNASRGTTRSGSVITTFGSKDPTVVLPIELTSFTATCDVRSTLVEWTTASERNNDYFSLERSDDAINFTEIARIASAGNSIEPLDYSYTDYGIHGGDNYYRLVQVDYDGTRTASEIVVANCVEYSADVEPEVMAFPNPFSGELTLVLDNFDNRAATIEVYDMLGKLIYTEKADAPQNSYETILNLSNLPSGAYTVRVSTTDFVINRNVVKN